MSVTEGERQFTFDYAHTHYSIASEKSIQKGNWLCNITSFTLLALFKSANCWRAHLSVLMQNFYATTNGPTYRNVFTHMLYVGMAWVKSHVICVQNVEKLSENDSLGLKTH